MGIKRLNRNELLEILHGITFCAEKTYLSHELCAEVWILTSKGASNWQESYAEPWPAFCVKGMEKKELDDIKQKIREEALTETDIVGTVFEAFVPRQNSCEIVWGAYFEKLLNGRLDEDGCLYVFFDSESEGAIPLFFSSKQELAGKMSEAYSDIYTCWEDMNDEQLQYYVEKYNTVKDFPLNHLTI